MCVCVCIHTHTHTNTEKLLQFPASEKLLVFYLGPWPLSKISVTNITACDYATV